MSDQAAERLLAKLRRFVAGLDDEEREAFAALLAPGVARAYREEDVSGFGLVDWQPAALREALVATLRDRPVRVIGLGE